MAKAEGWTKGVGKFHKELEHRDRLRPMQPVSKKSQQKAIQAGAKLKGALDVSRRVVDTDDSSGARASRRYISG